MKVGIFGSCQLPLCSDFFLNDEVKEKNNLEVVFSLPFYVYDPNYIIYRGILDYEIFDDLDCLIIEINNLDIDNEASHKKIIDYCLNKNIKIIKTFLIKFPIFPINWNGMGENKNDYLNWVGLENIDYKEKFNKCILSCRKSNLESDLSVDISDFIENNFNKQLLFTHSLHPTNILLYELWRAIFTNLSINIEDYNYIFKGELISVWHNPFTTKMMKDLNVQFDTIVDDDFYVNRYISHNNAI